jgi:hypothetical protein
MAGEKRLHDGFERDVVLWPSEAVALVGIDDINHRNGLLAVLAALGLDGVAMDEI